MLNFRFLVLFISFTWHTFGSNFKTSPIELTQQQNLEGLTYEFNRTINIFVEYKPLVYAFDVSVLKRTTNETQPAVNEFCNEEIIHFETLLNRKLNDIVTMEHILDSGLFKSEKTIFRKTFFSLNHLEADLTEFANAAKKEKCEIFKKVASDFTRIYFHIDKLSRSDYSLMDEIIDFLYLKHDTEKLLQEFYPRNISLPVNFKYTHEGDFFSHVKFRLQFHDEILFLIFSIPFYEKIDLYIVSNEPNNKNNSTFYALKSHTSALNWTKQISFSTDNLEESCFYAKQEFFCGKPEIKYNGIDGMDNMCFRSSSVNDTSKDIIISNKNTVITTLILVCIAYSTMFVLAIMKWLKMNGRLCFSNGIVFYADVEESEV